MGIQSSTARSSSQANKQRRGASTVAQQKRQSPQEQRYRKVYLLTLAPDGNFKGTKYQDVTTTGMVAAWRSIGVQSVVRKADLPDDFSEDTDLEQVELIALENLVLEDGGEYWPVYVTTKTSEKVAILEGWQRSLTTAEENSARKAALKELQRQGHADAKAYCGAKKVYVADRQVAEIDGAAIAQNCALIVEQKATLDADAAKQLVLTLQAIKLWSENLPTLKSFKGKRVMGALLGGHITSNATNAREMLQICSREGFQIFLPNGQGYSAGDSCTPSPNPTLCPAAAPALQSHDMISRAGKLPGTVQGLRTLTHGLLIRIDPKL
ncbi:hypothetical protein WJX73_009152 [Symbiochloris irregularis]|uniref:Uncharacterized protein n=1 Tax=Symbiochloris irregularis TaxID=706552 RepID=A0AAW1NP96_9CHLO